MANAHPPCPVDARLDGRDAGKICLQVSTSIDRQYARLGDLHASRLLVHVERRRVSIRRANYVRSGHAVRPCADFDIRRQDGHAAHAWDLPHAARLEPDGYWPGER